MKNEALQRENDELKLAANQTNDIDEINELRIQNMKYEKQIVEMEQFLHDYGLEWIGTNDEVEDEDATDNQHHLQVNNS